MRLLLLLLSCLGDDVKECNTKQIKQKDKKYIAYLEVLSEIAKKDPSPTFQIFFTSHDFITIYENPKEYFNLALTAIHDIEVSKEQKLVIICSVQMYLELDCFIVFIDECYRAYKNKTLSNLNFICLITNELDLERKLYINYKKNEKLSKLLDKIYIEVDNKYIRDTIESIRE